MIVKHILIDENEICIYARQFPNVKYLKLFFPPEESHFINCLQALFTVNDKINGNRHIWPQLINFSTEALCNIFYDILDKNDIRHWLITKTDLKYVKNRFYADYFNRILFMWF